MKMSVLSLATVVMFAMFFQCLPVSGSYLGYPRLNFAGLFRADSSTSNNQPCYYLLDDLTRFNYSNNWGANGTNEFQFFENYITSAVYRDGHTSTSDEVVGREIIGNLLRPFAKITNLDVDGQNQTALYGMNFGIRGLGNSPPVFYGNWTPSIIAQDFWARLKCYNELHHGSYDYENTFHLGSQGTTFVKDINWNCCGNSVALQQLKEAVGITDKLSVRVSMFHYTRNYPPFAAINATLGYVIGTIGAASKMDTLNFGGQRILDPTSNVPEGLSLAEDELCSGVKLTDYRPWMSKAPFEIDEKLKLIHVDFSNALPVNLTNNLYDMGTLSLGIFTDIQSTECVKLLGEDVPYLSAGFLSVSGGIYTVPVTDDDIALLSNSKLVVAQIISWSDSNTYTPICGEFLLPQADQHVANILLEETPYFVRPFNFYLDRLEYGKEPSTQTLYVTHFGKPVQHVDVKILQSPNIVIPLNGVQPDSWIKSTDESGMVTFNFSVTTKIQYPREYSTPQCPSDRTSLPIDGQYYQFVYCTDTDPSCTSYQNVNMPPLSFLAFSTVSYERPYDWRNDVHPIFLTYALTATVMNKILDLGSYTDVTLPHNLHLLNLSLKLEFEDPGYMPTSRDLSPTKQAMILEWLKNPIYDKNDIGLKPEDEVVRPCLLSISRSPYKPPRCRTKISKAEKPEKDDAYFGELFQPLAYKPATSTCHHAHPSAIGTNDLSQRPLFGLKVLRDAMHTRAGKENIIIPMHYDPLVQCNKESLQKQLQTAVQLEFATIPTYCTSLYSIVEDCNVDIYQRIRSVIIQEMLHMTQSANILIAIGGTPIIDDASSVPSFPTCLPGNVLPGLLVSLKKLSLEHVHNVFMGIEVPGQTDVGGHLNNLNLLTIGAFYDEIKECLLILDELQIEIFDPKTVPNQVQWPWIPTSEVGTVHTVIDYHSAIEGINEIVSEGEGYSETDPYAVRNDSLAHFFQFEEVVCQHKLVDNNNSYSYSGEPISFNRNGVWPMRDNPTKEGILPHTNCYTESRAFHETFRRLLRVLQETFSGKPVKIRETVKVMEALRIHAKKLMWTKYRPDSETDDTTCGPVWDYDWPENTASNVDTYMHAYIIYVAIAINYIII